MNGYSEDLRRKIVTAVERGMSEAQAARTFDVSLSSAKRYANKASGERHWLQRRVPAPPPNSMREKIAAG